MKPPPSTSDKSTSLSLLGTRIDNLSLQNLLKKGLECMSSSRPHLLVTANALMLLERHSSPSFSSALNSASLVVAESSGISWAARFQKKGGVLRVPGIDLALHLCRTAQQAGFSVFLLGGKPGVAERASVFLQNQIPGLPIAGVHHGYFSDHESKKIIDDIRSKRANLILIAFGMPKQEIWTQRYFNELPPGLYMGVGGSFDVWAGDLKRAPQWVQERGWEWMYRLFQEPFRWKRILQLPKFVGEVIKERQKSSRY